MKPNQGLLPELQLEVKIIDFIEKSIFQGIWQRNLFDQEY